MPHQNELQVLNFIFKYKKSTVKDHLDQNPVPGGVKLSL